MDQIVNGNHKLNTIVLDEVSIQAPGEQLFEHPTYNEIEEAIESLNTAKKMLLQMGIGKWYIGHYKKKTWKTPLPFYAWKCSDCGAITHGYPQGYRNDLYCNNCSGMEL